MDIPLLGGSVVKNLPANAIDTGSIHGSGRSPGEAMAIHSSIPAWRIPWAEEPGGLQYMYCTVYYSTVTKELDMT